MILAGDIGGTNSRLALFVPGKKKPVRLEVFPSSEYANLEAVLKDFFGKKPVRVQAACIGVAGPVINNRCNATNLPWVIDGGRIAKKYRIKRVNIINDLVALAFGALTVPKNKLCSIHGGALPKKFGGNIAVLAAGTGLGEAALVWNGTTFVPLATEGGHTDFAARDDVEVELLRFLRERFGRVSYERILSGPGIGNLYDFFRDARGAFEPSEIGERIRSAPDRNVAIVQEALAGKSEAAVLAIDRFIALYGAEAGNLALKTFATAGVFVAGSIAMHLLKRIEESAFSRAFAAKGRFSGFLEKVPVAVVLDSDIGLAGSALFAMRNR